jgi:hypothetical protein
MLELVTNPWTLGFVTPKLLQDVGTRIPNDGEASVPDMLAESLRVLQEMKLPVAPQPLSTVQQVRRFREEVDKQYQEMLRRREEARQAAKRAKRAAAAAEKRRQVEEIAKLKFPPPPIPGTAYIVPITTPAELMQEGELQSHCVGSCRWIVAQGSAYAYRILEPQRATVLISRAPSGVWRQRELRGTANAAPWPKTVCAVNAWLAEHQALG